MMLEVVGAILIIDSSPLCSLDFKVQWSSFENKKKPPVNLHTPLSRYLHNHFQINSGRGKTIDFHVTSLVNLFEREKSVICKKENLAYQWGICQNTH